MSKDYKPYGPEWEKEMMKMPKLALVKMVATVKQESETPDLLPSAEFSGSAKMSVKDTVAVLRAYADAKEKLMHLNSEVLKGIRLGADFLKETNGKP